MTEIDWLSHVFSFGFKFERETFLIERRSESTWAVTMGGRSCLDKEIMHFVYEPMPSNREDDFLAKTRFATKEDAYACLERWWSTWMRVGGGWVKRDATWRLECRHTYLNKKEQDRDAGGRTAKNLTERAELLAWCKQNLEEEKQQLSPVGGEIEETVFGYSMAIGKGHAEWAVVPQRDDCL